MPAIIGGQLRNGGTHDSFQVKAFAVSCPAATACIAVGSSVANGSGKTLVEAYSG